MKILYDFQIFSLQRFGGISRYYYHLMDEFHSSGTAEFELGLKYSQNDYLVDSSWMRDVSVPTDNRSIDDFLWGINFRGKGRLFSLYSKLFKNIDIYRDNKNESIRLLKQGNFDVFHPTYHHDDYFLDYLGSKPLVFTVYDMAHEIYPQFFSPDDPVYENKKKLVARADQVIAISENTKQDIIKLYGTESDKITVVHLAGPFDPNEPIPELDVDLPEKFILYVGTRSVYKNFPTFLEAVAPLIKNSKDLYLHCVGGGDFTPQEHELFSQLGIEDKVTNTVRVYPDVQRYIYSKAMMFVSPSLYEGFGIPILEAWACDCPIAISDASCYPEVAGDAAEYFDPENVGSIRETISGLVKDDNRRRQLVTLGRKRLGNYSSSKVAKETLDVYKKAVKK